MIAETNDRQSILPIRSISGGGWKDGKSSLLPHLRQDFNLTHFLPG